MLRRGGVALKDLAVIGHDGKLITDDKAMAHVYAAYRRGALVLDDGKPDLDPPSFGLMFGRWLAEIISQGSQAIVLSAKVGTEEWRETMPVGLAIIDYTGRSAYPDIHWFPEASPRNRIEACLAFLIELKKEHMVFFTVPGTRADGLPDWKQ